MIALLPIFILSFAIIILLIALFIFKIDTKKCATLTISGLIFALVFSAILGYKISFNTQAISDISSDNMQISVSSPLDTSDKTPATEQTVAIDAVPTEQEITTSENSEITESVTENNDMVGSSPNVDDTQQNDANNEWGAHHVTALFTCDGYGLLYTSLILIISIVVASLAYRWFVQEEINHGLFYIILLFMTLGGITLVYASHLMSFFLGIELLSIPFIGLIGYQYIQTNALEAAIKYTVVSLLLSTVGKVAVFCAIARLFLLAPIVNNETIRIILVIMAFCSILWGNLLALMQSSLKRLLAYSSVAHFGYLLLALIAVQYQVLALETIGVYLIGYIFANICVLGVISLESHSNELQDHEKEIDLSGLFWRRPILALAMGVGLLSLAGAPLTAGFVGRFLLVLLGVTAELWWLIAAVVIGSTIGLYFYSRLILNLYIRPPISHDDFSGNNSIIKLKWQDIKVSELFIVIAALLTMVCGVYPKWLFNLVSMAQYLTT